MKNKSCITAGILVLAVVMAGAMIELGLCLLPWLRNTRGIDTSAAFDILSNMYEFYQRHMAAMTAAALLMAAALQVINMRQASLLCFGLVLGYAMLNQLASHLISMSSVRRLSISGWFILVQSTGAYVFPIYYSACAVWGITKKRWPIAGVSLMWLVCLIALTVFKNQITADAGLVNVLFKALHYTGLVCMPLNACLTRE